VNLYKCNFLKVLQLTKLPATELWMDPVISNFIEYAVECPLKLHSYFESKIHGVGICIVSDSLYRRASVILHYQLKLNSTTADYFPDILSLCVITC